MLQGDCGVGPHRRRLPPSPILFGQLPYDTSYATLSCRDDGFQRGLVSRVSFLGSFGIPSSLLSYIVYAPPPLVDKRVVPKSRAWSNPKLWCFWSFGMLSYAFFVLCLFCSFLRFPLQSSTPSVLVPFRLSVLVFIVGSVISFLRCLDLQFSTFGFISRRFLVPVALFCQLTCIAEHCMRGLNFFCPFVSYVCGVLLQLGRSCVIHLSVSVFPSLACQSLTHYRT